MVGTPESVGLSSRQHPAFKEATKGILGAAGKLSPWKAMTAAS